METQLDRNYLPHRADTEPNSQTDGTSLETLFTGDKKFQAWQPAHPLAVSVPDSEPMSSKHGSRKAKRTSRPTL